MIGFLKGNTELRDQVQAALVKMYHDGTIYKIADEWEANGIEKASLCFDPSDKYIEDQQAAEEEQAAE